MNTSRPWFTVMAVLWACTFSACAMAPVRVSQLQVAPPVLLVANKSTRPLFIVLDPARVPDTVVIPEDDLKEIHVSELQTFVTRDLARAMSTWFERVEVVAPSFVFPDGAYVRADVRIDKLAGRVDKSMLVGNASAVAARVMGEMTWAFALRPSEDSEYLYSFAGVSTGTYAGTNVYETPKMFASTFEVAIAQMLKGMTDQKIPEQLLAR